MDGSRPRIAAQQLGVTTRRRRIVIGVALAIVAVLASVAWALLRDGTPAGTPVGAEAPLPIVSVTVPGRETVTRTVTFTGTIAARNDMQIAGDGETGRIAAVLVDVGDRVRAGQVLARLDTSTLQPEVERLGATLEQSRAEAELAQAEYERAVGVSAAGALSKEEIERRRSSSVTAAAKVRVAEAQLREGRARLARTEIRAPSAGIVLERSAEVGQIAGPGSGVLFRLAEGGRVELHGQVSEQDLPRLAVGQPASVRLTGIDEPFPGTVRLLGAIIDPASRLGEVRIELGEDPKLRPGAFARGEVTVGSEERPVVPQTAVLSDTQGVYVVVVGEGDRVARRAVRVSGATARGIVVAEGLTGTERVVSTAGAFLREGEQVAVAAPEAPKAGEGA